MRKRSCSHLISKQLRIPAWYGECCSTSTEAAFTGLVMYRKTFQRVHWNFRASHCTRLSTSKMSRNLFTVYTSRRRPTLLKHLHRVDIAGGKVGVNGVTGCHSPSLQGNDRGVLCVQSSRSSSEDEMSTSLLCGEDTCNPKAASLSCRMLFTAGFPPLNDPRSEDNDWTRSLGPNPNPESWFKDGTQIITSASEFAMSKSLDS